MTGFGGGGNNGNCVLSHVIAKERDYVAVMSVGSPGGFLWHVVCPKLGYALPEASHLTCLWPGIINRHFALLSQESDCRSSAFSEVLTERLFVAHWIESCPSGDTMYSHPSSLSVLPLVSRFIARVFLLSIRSIQRINVGAVGFWCSVVRCGGDPRMYFVLSRAVTCGTVDCTFVRTDAWLDFSQDLVSLWSKTREGQKQMR